MEFLLPDPYILEVSFIGTGGGYGESTVIHLFNNKWIVVDSCIDSNTGKCLPLEYLEKLGVNVSNDVYLVICTHWHDDHIQGISQLLRVAENAKFCMSNVNDTKKFLQLVQLDHSKSKQHTSESSTNEYHECLQLMKSRHSTYKRISVDTVIFSDHFDNVECKITSLSPSDKTMNDFDGEISTLIDNYGLPGRKIVTQTPNAKSVVLLLEVGNHKVLLGGDLEVGNDPEKGWLAILDHCNAVKGKKATLIKIPHHGSQNGYNERIWVELINENPVSKISPYNLGHKLPTLEMLTLFCSHSERVYMTSKVANCKPKKRDHKTEKMLKFFEYNITNPKSTVGIVRSRIHIGNNDSNWETEFYSEAFHVNKEFEL